MHCIVFFVFFFLALQADRDTPVHTFCGGVHIPAALMLQAQRGQQLCRYNYSGWILHLSLCLGNCVQMSCFYVNIVFSCVSEIGFHHYNSDQSGMLSSSVCVFVSLPNIIFYHKSLAEISQNSVFVCVIGTEIWDNLTDLWDCRIISE